MREVGKVFLSFCSSGWEGCGFGQQTGVTHGSIVMAGGQKGITVNSKGVLSTETDPEVVLDNC